MSGAEEEAAASAAAAVAAKTPAAEKAPVADDSKAFASVDTEKAAETSEEQEEEASEMPAETSGKEAEEQAESEPAAADETAAEKEVDAASPAADNEQEGGGDKPEGGEIEGKDVVQAKKTPRRRNSDNATGASPGRKKTPAASRKTKKAAADEGEETESDAEKKPRKRAKTDASATKKTPARKKKPAKKVEESEDESEDEEQKECARRVDQLPSEIKAKFGEIVWAKMGGYPFWPSLITDPRLLPDKLQKTAMKDLESKFFLYFYATKNFAAVLHKNIAPWNDETFKYREGHPEKDSKAPKRRQQLMEAIEEADKELLLPVDQRVDGLLKPQEKPVKAKPEPETTTAQSKRRTGKSPAAKSKKESAAAASSAKKGKKAKQSSDAAEEAEQQATPETTAEEEEDDSAGTPTLSKEEIKAKVASRKTPSRKKVDGGDAGAKKSSKTQAKGGSKASGTSTSSKADIDTKRKKEIELVVPHKSVKSADIREATEEAAKRSRSDKSKGRSKDKAAYKVGDLAAFASKMTRLQAQESAKNNDELVAMLGQLLKEDMIYRSDVERSGLAAIIAVLRKNSNPTVASTASAVRKHMIAILNYDTTADDKVPSKKKHAADGDAALRPATKKPKLGNASADAADAGATKTETTSSEQSVKTESNVEHESPTEVKTESGDSKGLESEKANIDAATDAKVEDPAASAAITDPLSSSSSTKSTDGNAKVKDEDVFKGETSLDKNRVVFVEMLGEVLKLNGPAHDKMAKEIEGLVFDRYKESNGDYRSQARLVIFGLRDNAKLRERLFAGTLHCLEIAYASDEFFKSTE